MRIVYLIQNDATKEIYFGKTDNLKRRLAEHNSGQQAATRRKSGNWILVYAEAYRNADDADIREMKIKQHGSNKRWLINRVKASLIKN